VHKQSRRKTVPRQILGCSCCNGEAPSGSENETCLEAAGPGGCRAWARQSAAASGAARQGVHGCAHLEAAHGDDLLSPPDLEGERAGSLAEDGIGAVIEGVERWNHASAPDPDEAGIEEISRKLAEQLATQIMPGQGKSRSIQRFQKIF
jgi:hypothetical protein